MSAAHRVNPSSGINVEVFIHKVDGIPVDLQASLQRYIAQCVTADLVDEDLDELAVSYVLPRYGRFVVLSFSKFNFRVCAIY